MDRIWRASTQQRTQGLVERREPSGKLASCDMTTPSVARARGAPCVSTARAHWGRGVGPSLRALRRSALRTGFGVVRLRASSGGKAVRRGWGPEGGDAGGRRAGCVQSAQIWPEIDQVRPRLADVGQFGPKLCESDRIRPKLANVGQSASLVEFGEDRASVRIRANFGQIWPHLVKFRSRLAKLDRCWSSADQRIVRAWPDLGQIWPTLANLGAAQRFSPKPGK